MFEVRRDGAGCYPVTFLNFENHPTPFLMHILGWDAIPVHNQLMEILFYFPPINKLVKTILKFAAIHSGPDIRLMVDKIILIIFFLLKSF